MFSERSILIDGERSKSKVGKILLWLLKFARVLKACWRASRTGRSLAVDPNGSQREKYPGYNLWKTNLIFFSNPNNSRIDKYENTVNDILFDVSIF